MFLKTECLNSYHNSTIHAWEIVTSSDVYYAYKVLISCSFSRVLDLPRQGLIQTSPYQSYTGSVSTIAHVFVT